VVAAHSASVVNTAETVKLLVVIISGARPILYGIVFILYPLLLAFQNFACDLYICPT